uniref:Uncharacterized protein n=1 Tax=Rhizophora mucronata TaxID=61149 RepID=A0A2P2P8E9_RHIMU
MHMTNWIIFQNVLCYMINHLFQVVQCYLWCLSSFEKENLCNLKH